MMIDLAPQRSWTCISQKEIMYKEVKDMELFSTLITLFIPIPHPFLYSS